MKRAVSVCLEINKRLQRTESDYQISEKLNTPAHLNSGGGFFASAARRYAYVRRMKMLEQSLRADAAAHMFRDVRSNELCGSPCPGT